jgi:hypothetical protein
VTRDRPTEEDAVAEPLHLPGVEDFLGVSVEHFDELLASLPVPVDAIHRDFVLFAVLECDVEVYRPPVPCDHPPGEPARVGRGGGPRVFRSRRGDGSVRRKGRVVGDARELVPVRAVGVVEVAVVHRVGADELGGVGDGHGVGNRSRPHLYRCDDRIKPGVELGLGLRFGGVEREAPGVGRFGGGGLEGPELGEDGGEVGGHGVTAVGGCGGCRIGSG